MQHQKKPVEGVEDFMGEKLLGMCQEEGFLTYSCLDCGGTNHCLHFNHDLCLFAANKKSLIQNTNLLVEGKPEIKKNNQSYYAYHQAVHCCGFEDPPREHLELPKCIVVGIQERYGVSASKDNT